MIASCSLGLPLASGSRIACKHSALKRTPDPTQVHYKPEDLERFTHARRGRIMPLSISSGLASGQTDNAWHGRWKASSLGHHGRSAGCPDTSEARAHAQGQGRAPCSHHLPPLEVADEASDIRVDHERLRCDRPAVGVQVLLPGQAVSTLPDSRRPEQRFYRSLVMSCSAKTFQ